MDLRNLNPEQRQAAEHLHGPILIAAGAGSGKTRTLTHRLAHLIQSGIKPEHIAAVTFTNKAAREMKERIEGLKIQGEPFIGTLHSFGARILKHEATAVGRNQSFSIFDSDDSLRVIKNIIKAAGFDGKKVSASLTQDLISKSKNELIDAAGYQEAAENDFEKKVGVIFERYEQALARNNGFDFDDLIEKPVRIFKAHPEVLAKYSDQFRYLLVDEYQDINTSQYWLLKLLAEKHQNICVVGDDNQAIYSFRQADFRNFLNFEKDWPSAKVILLEENYRSSGNIIKSASALIANNSLQKPKTLWTKNNDGELIAVARANTPEEEADYIAAAIETAKKEDPEAEIAILYRTNAQSRALEHALLGREIPYEIFGGLKFYERKEIKDIIAGLRFASNPQDEVSRERIEKTFYKKVAIDLIRELPERGKTLSVPELIDFFLERTNYIESLRHDFKNYLERIENIQEFVHFAGYYSDFRPPLGLQLFLEQISLMQPHDVLGKRITRREKEASRSVKLMTLHLSKGLEFETVFVSGCNEGTMPHFRSLESKADIEEERRLMYVGMTRAKKKLYLTCADSPSRFLYELPPELVTFQNIGSSRNFNEAYYLESDDTYLDY